MTAPEWAIKSREGLQWPCTNRETAEAAQHTNPQMTILCRAPGGVWQVAGDSPAPVSELARLRSERAETNAALSKAVEDCAALTKRAAELEAAAPAELTVYRASHDSITFGLYTTVEAAWTHCKTYAEREFPAPVAAFWSEGDDGVTELMVSVHGSADIATGYMVTPLTVASAYDPDGGE